MTRDECRDRVASKLSMKSTEELGLIVGWIQEGVVQYLTDTKARVRDVALDFTAGVQDYTLPAGILAFESIWVAPSGGNPSYELEQVGSSEMLRRRQWAYVGDSPQVYQLLGMDLLRVWPVPSATDTLHVLYVPAPATLASGDDLSVVGVPLPDHPVIEAYASWKAADWDDDVSSKVGQSYREEYMVGLQRAKVRRNRFDGGWGPVRPRRTRWIPRTPGTDVPGY